MTRRPFTPEELDFIQEHVEFTPIIDLAAELDRSPQVISNLCRRNEWMSLARMECWQSHEDTFLKENYPKLSCTAIGDKLGRTRLAVESRVKKLRSLGVDLWKMKK